MSQSVIQQRSLESLDLLADETRLVLAIKEYLTVVGISVSIQELTEKYRIFDSSHGEELDLISQVLEEHAFPKSPTHSIEALVEGKPLGVVGLYFYYKKDRIAWMENITKYPVPYLAERLGYLVLPKLNSILQEAVAEYSRGFADKIMVFPYPNQERLLLQYYGFRRATIQDTNSNYDLINRINDKEAVLVKDL
jgi:hypothetical protein